MGTITTGPIGRRTAPLAAAVAVALLLGGTAARPAVAARDQSAVDEAVSVLEQECYNDGGVPTVDWTFDDNGDVTQAVITCNAGAETFTLCVDGNGDYCPGTVEPPLTTPPGPIIAPPAGSSQNANPSATSPPGQPVLAPPSGQPVTRPLTSGDQSAGGNGGQPNGGNGAATPPTTGSGATAPSEPTPPSGGTLPGAGHAATHHNAHKHHGHKPGQVTPLQGKAAQAAAHHAKAKAKPAPHAAQHSHHKAT